MTLREIIDKTTSIGRQISSAEIPAYVNGVEKIESIELSRMNNGNIYANINTKKSQRIISAKAKEALYSKTEDTLLNKALDNRESPQADILKKIESIDANKMVDAYASELPFDGDYKAYSEALMAAYRLGITSVLQILKQK